MRQCLPDQVHRVRNLVLGSICQTDLKLLRPRLEHVELRLNTVVVAAGEPVEYLHFIERGSVSMITVMKDGTRIEVGLVGHEGVVGLPLLLGAETSALEGMVQVAGAALRLPAAALRTSLTDVPGLLASLLRYVDAFHGQVMQSAACNLRHHVEQRLAKWILMTHDRVEGQTFGMTQEFLSTMLGVRRPSVTLAMGALRRAGLVEHNKGRLQVLDRSGLEAAACECYEIAWQRFAWLNPRRHSPRPSAGHQAPPKPVLTTILP